MEYLDSINRFGVLNSAGKSARVDQGERYTIPCYERTLSKTSRPTNTINGAFV